MRRQRKRIRNLGKLALLAALTLSFTIPGAVHAESPKAEDAPQVYSSDVVNPVIEAVTMEGIGSTVQAGNTIPLKIQAYDQDDGIASINVYVEYTSADNQHSKTEFLQVEGTAEKNYIIQIPAKAGGYVKAEITGIIVTDKNGNYTVAQVQSEDTYEYLYHFMITGSEPIQMTIQDVNIQQNGQTLQHNDTLNLTAHIPESLIDSIESVELYFYNEEADQTRYFYLESEATNEFKGTFAIESDMENGTWRLSNISAEGKKSALVNVSADTINFNDHWFAVTGEVTKKDTTDPVITSFDMTHKGEFLTAGDTINFRVTAEDETGLSDSEYAYLDLKAVTDIVSPFQSVCLTYNKAENAYIGEYTIPENLYPCEWVVNDIRVMDKQGNQTNFNDYLLSYTSNPFYFKMKSGNAFTNPVYNVNITFHALNETGEYRNLTSITKQQVERRSTFKENGFTFPEVSTTYKGLKFVGWVDANGREINENTEITEESRYEEIYAKYDQMVIPVDYIYPDENLRRSHEQSAQIVPYGTTYKELFNDLKGYTTAKLYDRNNFDQWALDTYSSYNSVSDLNKEIKFSPNDTILLYAYYKDKVVVEVDRSYYDTQGKNAYEEHMKILDKGTTFEALIKDLKKENKPTSYEGLRFKEWEISTFDTPLKNEIKDNYSYLYMSAIYENYLVRFMIDNRSKAYESNSGSRAAGGGAAGGYFDSEVEYVINMVAEKNEKITVPEFPNYKKITWIEAKPEGDNLIIKDHMVFRGYGEKIDDTASNKPVTPEKPTTPENPSTLEKPSSTLAEKVIQDVVHDIKAAEKGGRIDVTMGTASIVPVDILKAAKGKDVTVNLHMNGYTWTIHGKDILADNLKDINLEVAFDTNAVPSKTAKALAGDNPIKQLSLTHTGDFGFKADLSFNIGSEYNGKYGNLYYYDSEGKLIFQNAGKIDANGNVSLSFSHASDYVVVITDKIMENEKSDNSAINAPENTDNETQINNVESSPNTGDTTNVTAIFYLFLASLFAGYIIMRKRLFLKNSQD